MLLLCGKSCAGKDTIKNELINLGMKPIVTYTTRPPRPGEKNHISYHFISKKDFIDKKNNGFFAEATSYKVVSGEIWYYGSAVEDLTEDKVIIVNPYGLMQIKKIKSLNPISFYIFADRETLWDRLIQRKENLNEAKRRLEEDNKDFENIEKDVDFIFKNDGSLKPELLAEMILYTYKKSIEKEKNKFD